MRASIRAIMHADVVVIGGGVVGLACAVELQRAGRETVVLEQHRGLGTETTSRSSEVIHAGLYYPHASLKAETCVRGAELLYAWCEAHKVPFARVGKLVVAVATEEEARLDELAALATRNGAHVQMIDRARIQALEPNVRAASALLSPNTGIVDTHALVASLAANVTARGGMVARGRRVIAVEPTAEGFTLACDGVAGRETLEASSVVNAAGLYADVIAGMFGWSIAQRFVKGSYFRVKGPIVERLVYPLPPGDGSLGIHATVDLAGAVRIGPDTEPALSRTDYALDESRRTAFHAAAVRYLPSLREEDLIADTCGIRPKIDGGDFIIEHRNGVVHLVGIESPGLTASLAIAERVAMLLS
jgi:L-2-hydroxyglutarate oxidase LhgO